MKTRELAMKAKLRLERRRFGVSVFWGTQLIACWNRDDGLSTTVEFTREQHDHLTTLARQVWAEVNGGSDG